METGYIALIALMMAACMLGGICIGKRRTTRQSIQGVLNIDCGDPESTPYLFLQLEVPIEDVVNLKTASFAVRILK